MSGRKRTKTFGMTTPTDLHYKLLFDIERLRSARSSEEARYAAFDCAVGSWHLVDWTLHAVDGDGHERLTGLKSTDPRPKGMTIEAVFKDRQDDRLPALKFCHIIANSVKHREVRNDSMQNLWTGSTAKFHWSEPAKDTGNRFITAVDLVTYLVFDGDRHNALDLFEAMAEQWQTFLSEEGILEPRPDFEELEID
jgi:hypothetical protein